MKYHNPSCHLIANFFEIDHPGTASLKAEGIEKMGPRSKLHLIAADLGERKLVDVLADNKNWEFSEPTIIVAEGLLQYLPPKEVRDLFTQCAAVTGANSRIAFTYVGTRENGKPNAGPWSWLVLWILKAGGESWLWGIPTEELGPFLEKTHWTLSQEQVASSDACGVEFHGVALKQMTMTFIGNRHGYIGSSPPLFVIFSMHFRILALDQIFIFY